MSVCFGLGPRNVSQSVHANSNSNPLFGGLTDHGNSSEFCGDSSSKWFSCVVTHLLLVPFVGDGAAWLGAHSAQ